ncbi:cytochrome P450 [Deinococcus psychrotolerans]|uniref:Cytochrome P450 n=1 Tax=Deinococcus psychrotolerans TaxID=2489213 RepID=A0A3G8YDN4_9DEIO|nr:cytochrome P450 [Deinococcus psychrotolerans]AZI43468.1 cytochrome P450 [Deinococcus psychrotolerans]
MTISAHPNLSRPLNVFSREFARNKYEYYRLLREHSPVHKGKLAVLDVYLLSRYDDCAALLKDPRLVRDRSRLSGKTGGSKFPLPLPRTVQLMGDNMLLSDGAEHRRLRGLVHQAFTPRALAKLESRLEALTHELLDALVGKSQVDLIPAYALPIPVAIIGEMLGVSASEMGQFKNGLTVMSSGLSGAGLIKTLLWDMPELLRLIRGLIARKRAASDDDILTGLIHAEEDGQRLSEDELLSMVLLLITAGYETTYNLIANSVVALLTHPAQLAWLQVEPERLSTAIEEVLRFSSPIQGTKPAYATETIMIRGIAIPKGAMVAPLLGAANRDPAVFEQPDDFRIDRTPNKHLGFGQGIHYCLGAPLARLETRVALRNLLERFPELRLAVSPSDLKRQHMPLWERYESLPVLL